VDVLSEHLLGPVPGFILVIFGGYGPVHGLTPFYLVDVSSELL
jgi:hypothetical protein